MKIEYTSRSIEPRTGMPNGKTPLKPIEINSDCVIRADFHPSFNKQYELLINPKMSFGTGHHQTTHMMLELALSLFAKEEDGTRYGMWNWNIGYFSFKNGSKNS